MRRKTSGKRTEICIKDRNQNNRFKSWASRATNEFEILLTDNYGDNYNFIWFCSIRGVNDIIIITIIICLWCLFLPQNCHLSFGKGRCGCSWCWQFYWLYCLSFLFLCSALYDSEFNYLVLLIMCPYYFDFMALQQLETAVHNILPRIPVPLQEATTRLLSKDPTARPTSQLLQLIKYFRWVLRFVITVISFSI